MNILIRSARIIDTGSADNGKTKDIWIVNGIIKEIGTAIKAENATLLESENLHISPGWFDMRVNFRDPGFEYKEDLFTGMDAAIAGGFTAVACMPSTLPPIHSKSEVEYILNKTKGFLVDVYPVGTVSHRHEGKDLSEMYDMHLSGAIAFSDDKKPLSDPGLLQRALLYVKSFNGLIISFPDDKNISLDGKINEGIVSTSTGLKGIPGLAEELMIQRDIFLTQYAESRIHFATVSTANSVELIRKSKKSGLNVTAEVSASHLILDENNLTSFDTNYKIKPPLRTANDIKALIEGLIDGTIDVICSDHSPEDEEMKKREFDHAAFGIIALESAFGAANTALDGKLSIEKIIEKIAVNPRTILNLKVPSIKVGEIANITLFNPNQKWVFEKKHIKSKSKNTPFVGSQFTGKPFAVVNNNQMSFCD
ncbi:MAG: dihydroorotase [Bacteroidetes bacterium]|nr:dihydroorotase [Bacteroidota bacterium]HET6243072.1 dihydroorotase [Bacteroidia bacterium]